MAINSLMQDLTQLIIEGLNEQVKRAYQKRKSEMIEEFKKQLDQEQDDIIAKTVLRLSRNYSINTLENKVIIEVMNFKTK